MSLKSYFPRVLIALTLFMGACGDSNDADTPDPGPNPPAPELVPTLSAAPASLSFKAEGETLELTVTAENVNWKAEAVDDWLTIEGGSGSANATVKVTAASNTATAERSTSIVVTGKDVNPITVTVKQAAAEEPLHPSLSVAPEALSFKAEGETLELTVTAKDVNWTATCDASWLTITGGSGSSDATVQVKAEPNTASTPLSATIVFAGEGVDPVSIAVTQAAKIDDPVQPVTLTYAEAYWAGDYWDTAGSLNDLYIILTDMPMQNGALTYPGKIIQLDLNIPATTFDKVETVVAGTYSPSYTLTPLQRYTFNSDEVSYIWDYDAAGDKTATHYTTGGSVTIVRSAAGYTIDLDLTMDDQSTYRARFEGRMVFYDDTIKHLSTLDRSIQPSLTQASGTFYEYSDTAIAARALELSFYGDLAQSTIDNMILMLNVDPEAQKEGAIEGTYTVIEKSIDKIATTDMVKGTVVPGYLTKDSNDELLFAGSWYRLLANIGGEAQLGGMAPFTSGRVVITRDGETYTVGYQFVDDNEMTPHAITGTYTGPIVFTNLSGGTEPDPGPGPGPGPGPDPKPGVDVSTGGQLSQWKPGGRW